LLPLASSNTNPSTNHLPALTVAVFFGRNILYNYGCANATAIQSQDEFHFDPIDKILNYSELVITGLAMSSIFFIVASMGIIPVAAGRILETTRFATFAYNCMFIGFCLLCGFCTYASSLFNYRSNSSSCYLRYSLHVIRIFL
jgi:hypothetical protein